MRIDSMPTSAQSLCLPPTYHREPGSSPTRIVPSPGTTPCSRRRAIRALSSSLIAAAVALPSSLRAVTTSVYFRGSVSEVARAGEVEGDAGSVGRGDDLLVTDRAARGDDGADPGVDEHLQ